MNKSLYIKCLRVIDSCDTIEQLHTAARYIIRAKGLLTDLSYSFIAHEVVEKWAFLTKETTDEPV